MICSDSLHEVYRSSAKAKQARKRTDIRPSDSTDMVKQSPSTVSLDSQDEQPQAKRSAVDIIDNSLLECIAPVEVNDLAALGIGFWDMSCQQV